MTCTTTKSQGCRTENPLSKQISPKSSLNSENKNPLCESGDEKVVGTGSRKAGSTCTGAARSLLWAANESP